MPDQKKYINGDNLVTYDGIIKDWFQSQGAKTVSGNPVVITDAEPMNADHVVATITPTQTGSGTPSPSNVRQFVGFTSVEVSDHKKNFLDILSFKKMSNNVTLTPSGNDLRVQVDGSTYSGAYVDLNIPNGVYALSCSWVLNDPNDRTACIQAFNSNDQQIYNSYATASDGNINGIKLYINDNFVRIRFFASWSGNKGDTTYKNIQLELGKTSTTYEPYQGQTYTVQLGDTYYGATLDVTSGKLRAEWIHYNLTTSDVDNILGYQPSSGYKALLCDLSALSLPANDNQNDVMFNAFEHVLSGHGQNFGSASIYPNGKLYFWANDLNGSTGAKEALKNIINDSGVEFSYKLATPIEIQLTPQQIALLENYNTLTTNASNLEVKYQTNTTIGDTLSVLDKRITQLDGGKANGAGLTFSVDQNGILCVTY